MIRKAVEFAIKAHEGSVRKGTDIPYVMHPLEAAVIVSMITKDPVIIAAAVLHDVIEDTFVTREELEENFGPEVAALVAEESEDKTKSWKERKSHTVDHLKNADIKIKIIALGDKLSNIRSTAREYLLVGDNIWQRFNEKNKESHKWYYWNVAFAIKELEEYHAYKEYVNLCELVFGKYN